MQDAISSLQNLSWYFIDRFVLVKDKEDLSSIFKQVRSCTNILKIPFENMIDFSIMHIAKLKNKRKTLTNSRREILGYNQIFLFCYLLIILSVLKKFSMILIYIQYFHKNNYTITQLNVDFLQFYHMIPATI